MAYAIFSRSFTPALPVGVIHVMLPVDKVKVMLAFSEVICHAASVERIANPVRMILNKPLLSVQFPGGRGMTGCKELAPRPRTMIEACRCDIQQTGSDKRGDPVLIVRNVGVSAIELPVRPAEPMRIVVVVLLNRLGTRNGNMVELCTAAP